MENKDHLFEWKGRTYDPQNYLFLVPVIYDDETKDQELDVPDNDLHFFPKAAEEIRKGKKILLFDKLPEQYRHPAKKADPSRIMHIRTVVMRQTGMECLALFTHLDMLLKAYKPLHIGVISYEEAVQYAKEFGILVIDPGFVNKLITLRDREVLTRNRTGEEANFELLKDRMCGTLVAQYKKSHNVMFRDEYVRRLKTIGFTGPEAENLFLLELMILKSTNTDVLADTSFIYKQYLPLSGPVLTQDDQWYIDHQMFLVSEITKIFDEAEYIWRTMPQTLTDPERKTRIHALTRYGGGKLFINYLDMISEKSHTDFEKIRIYGMKELDLLYLYRWGQKDVPYPYMPDQLSELDESDAEITIRSYGNGKVTCIKYIRRVTGCSLAEAKNIVENLPQTLKGTVPMEKAIEYRTAMEAEGAKVEIRKV